MPGGVLVYSTCTTLPEENEEVVQAFLSESSDFLLLPANELPEAVRPLVGADGVMRCLPHRHDMDGFVAHRIRRKP